MAGTDGEHSSETSFEAEATPPTAERGPPRRALLKLSIRIVIGGGIIAFLLVRSDPHEIADAIGGANLVDVFLALLVVLGVVVVGAFRWQAFLRSLDMALPTATLLRLYFVGTFFNAFLPTGIGGDAYKAVRIGRAPGTLSKAIASVLLDRMAGVTGQALLTIAAVAIQLSRGDRNAVAAVALALSVGIVAAAVALVVFSGYFSRLGRTQGRWGIRGRLGRTVAAMALAGRDRRAATVGLGLGVVTAVGLVVTQVLLARALGIDVDTAALASILLITNIAVFAPLSINGLGIREAVYVWGLGLYGVDHDVALAFSLLMLALLLISSAVGGIVYMVAGGEVSAPASVERAAAVEAQAPSAEGT